MGFLRLFAIGICFCAGCIPSRHAYLGFDCDPAHPCPFPLVCTQGECSETSTDGGLQDGGTDAGARDNLVLNPSFEDSLPLSYWIADGPFSYSTQFARTGTTSLHLELSTKEVHNNVPTLSLSGEGLYCVEAWVSGSGPATVSFSYRDPIKGAITSVDRPEAHATLQKDQWVPVRTRLMVGQGFGPTVSVSLTGPGWLDDVSVWQSGGGECKEY